MTAGKTILVVDDDPMLREGLQALLQKSGYQTLEAEDGMEAREIIDDRHPDLVILDMMMPRWGGFAVLEHFRSQPDAPPFIMITAHEGDKHRAYAQQIGVLDYLRKPFSLDSLLQRVDRHLQDAAPAKPEAPTGDEEARAIRVCCPGCGARIKAPVQMLGLRRPCPRCNQMLTIKRDPPQDEGPRLLLDELLPG
jgi:DNA-binding response OmpR family regulator